MHFPSYSTLSASGDAAAMPSAGAAKAAEHSVAREEQDSLEAGSLDLPTNALTSGKM